MTTQLSSTNAKQDHGSYNTPDELRQKAKAANDALEEERALQGNKP